MRNMVGKRLGAYQVIELIGEGSQAAVYRARQEALEREVAIKVLGVAPDADPNFRRRFEQEARIVAKLEHPNILPVYDFGEQDGCIYFVSRLVSGGSLAERLNGGSLTSAVALAVVEQVARALDYAHQRDVVHRDVKPANILMCADGQALLADFGIAKLLSDGAVRTDPGSAPGTPAYMSPDPAFGETPDGRSDQYSLAVVAYEMLTGKRPFRGETPHALVIQHVHLPVEFDPGVFAEHPKLVEVLRRALAKQSEFRFASCTEFAEQLRDALTNAAPASLPQQPVGETRMPGSEPARLPARRALKRWAVAGLAALGVVLLASIGGTAVWRVAHRGAPALAPEVGEDPKAVAPAPSDTPLPVPARPPAVPPWTKFRVAIAMDATVENAVALGVARAFADQLVQPLQKDLDRDQRLSGAFVSNCLLGRGIAEVSEPAALAAQADADLVVVLSYELVSLSQSVGPVRSVRDGSTATVTLRAQICAPGNVPAPIERTGSGADSPDTTVAVDSAIRREGPAFRAEIMERLRDWTDAALRDGVETRIALLIEDAGEDAGEVLSEALADMEAVVPGSLRREADADVRREKNAVRIPPRSAHDSGAPLVLPIGPNDHFSLWSVRLKADRTQLVLALEQLLRTRYEADRAGTKLLPSTRIHEDTLALCLRHPHPQLGERGERRTGNGAALPANASWKPLVLPEGEFFPSYVVSHATQTQPESRDTSRLGDPSGVLGVTLVAPAAGVHVTVEVEGDPLFDVGSFDGVLPEAGRSYVVCPKLVYHYETLVGLRQSQPVDITFRVWLGSEYFEQRVETVAVHSINDCLYVRLDSSPSGETQGRAEFENFAAYVNENHPQLEELRRQCLREGLVTSFAGYQGGDPEQVRHNVLSQVAAIWTVLKQRGLKYSSITDTATAQRSTCNQHVRLVEESLSGEQANCVDGSVLFASALKQIGLDPYLVLVPGHCFLAFRVGADDSSGVCALETTMLGSDEFAAAVQAGVQRLEACGERFGKDPSYQLVSVREARRHGIHPIPYLAPK